MKSTLLGIGIVVGILALTTVLWENAFAGGRGGMGGWGMGPGYCWQDQSRYYDDRPRAKSGQPEEYDKGTRPYPPDAPRGRGYRGDVRPFARDYGAGGWNFGHRGPMGGFGMGWWR